jgi:glutathione-regulated potassium-efflux system protein KefB
VLLADSEFRHELESQIEPFKGLLLGLFFMAVGMSIDLARIAADPMPVLSLVAVLMGVKLVLVHAIGRWPGGLPAREAVQLAVVLALGGEFAFVVFAEAARVGLLDADARDRLVAAVGVSMALTPLLLASIARALATHPPPAPSRDYDTPPDDLHPQVLVAGFGRFGQIVARLLAAQRVPFVAIEHSADQVDFVRRFGNPVYYGDPSRPDLLRAAGAAHVRVFVIAVDDPAANLRTVRVIRRHYPQAKVFSRARDRRHAWQLMDLGAHAIRETFHSSLRMGEEVLVALGVAPEVARDHAHRFREHDERLLNTQYLVHDDEDALLQSSRDARRELERLFDADFEEGARPQAPMEPENGRRE